MTSRRRCEAALILALAPGRMRASCARRRANLRDARDALVEAEAPGTVVLVTGPSGSGKSTLLRMLAQARRRAVVAPGPHMLGSSCAVEQVGDTCDEALRLLARVGLSDAPALLRSADRLSEGERARLALAIAMDEARRTDAPLVLVDEFCSTLDGRTATSVACCFAAWVRSAHICAVVASARDDLIEKLSPDRVCRLDDDADSMWISRGDHVRDDRPSHAA